MSCSKAKRASPGPAIDVYDGPAFRSLRKAMKAGIRPDVLIVSAKYGLVSEDTRVRPYDQRLSPEPDAAYIATLREALKRIDWQSYDCVFTFLGPTYAAAVGDIQRELSPHASLEKASGPIGMRLGALKRWLWSLHSEAPA